MSTTTTTTTAAQQYYFVQLDYYEPDNQELYRGKAYYRLRVIASQPQNMSAAIFVHRRTTSSDPGNPTHDEFTGVAGPLDLVNIPADTPDQYGRIRKTSVDLLLDTVSLVDEAKEIIEQGVAHLLDGLTSLDQLTLNSTVTLKSPKYS